MKGHRITTLAMLVGVLGASVGVATDHVQALPPNVAAQQYTATTDPVDVYIGLTLDGYADPDFASESGLGAGAKLTYTLTFWNVGELQLGKGAASISRVYVPYQVYADPDELVPAELHQTVVQLHELTFSGGPEGTFRGTNSETGLAIVGHVEQQNGIWYAVFTEDIKQTYVVGPAAFVGWPRCEGGGDSGARFSNISRIVEIFPDNDPEDVRSAKPDSVLNVCDHVLTGEDSLATITFSDLSVISLKAETEIVINSPPRAPTRLEALAGRFLMNVERVLAGESIEVKSNMATVGIKGTTLVVEVSETETIVKVIEGVVEVTSSASGQTAPVGAGQALTASAEGLASPVPFDAAAEAALWDDGDATPVTVVTEESSAGDSSTATVVVVGAAVLASLLGVVLLRRRRTR